MINSVSITQLGLRKVVTQDCFGFFGVLVLTVTQSSPGGAKF